MSAMRLLGVVLLAFVISCVMGSSVRTWQSNINFNNPSNWNLGRIPCEGDRIILQKSETILVQLPDKHMYMRELVLPSSSELLLPQDGLVQFTGLQKLTNCVGQDITFKPVKPSLWIEAHNWDGWNMATPDLERIPCTSDTVRFSPGNIYKVMMPDNDIEIAFLELNKKVIDDLLDGSYMFYHPKDYFGPTGYIRLTFTVCNPNFWCECGNEYLESEMCSKMSCAIPNCQMPVQPHGFCCPICGAYLLLNINETMKKQEITNHLKRILSPMGIVWHASKVGESVQIVLVEQGEYSGKISEETALLKSELDKVGLQLLKSEIHSSGRVWYPTSLWHIIGHFLSLMILAALIISAVYVYYSFNWPILASLTPVEGRPFVFARFENQTEEVVVEHEERPPTNMTPQTFDNPMYEEAARQFQGEEGFYDEKSPICTKVKEQFSYDAASIEG